MVISCLCFYISMFMPNIWLIPHGNTIYIKPKKSKMHPQIIYRTKKEKKKHWLQHYMYFYILSNILMLKCLNKLFKIITEERK